MSSRNKLKIYWKAVRNYSKRKSVSIKRTRSFFKRNPRKLRTSTLRLQRKKVAKKKVSVSTAQLVSKEIESSELAPMQKKELKGSIAMIEKSEREQLRLEKRKPKIFTISYTFFLNYSGVQEDFYERGLPETILESGEKSFSTANNNRAYFIWLTRKKIYYAQLYPYDEITYKVNWTSYKYE